jgi:SAM-dependent methyltransferase
MMEPWFEAAFAGHYPLLYAHRNEREAADCLDLLQSLWPLPAVDPILDLGCGQGRHLALLRERGLPALGLDLSAELLALARRRGEAAPPLLRGDMRFLPLRDASCGGVLSLFTAFGYFGDLAANAVVIDEVARVLQPGACWYLDYVDCCRVRDELAGRPPAVRRREMGPLQVEEVRQLDAAGSQVAKTVKLYSLPGEEDAAAELGIGPAGLEYTEQIALFQRDELVALASGRGLEMVAGVGSYHGAPLDQGPRWILVFQREGEAP